MPASDGPGPLKRVLFRARARDLFCIFLCLFGLIVLASFAISKCTADRARNELAKKQTLQEQQLQEEMRQGWEEQKRLEAQRQQALQEEQERVRAEAAERRKREEDERRRLAEFEELRHGGVRGLAISPAMSKPVNAVGVWVAVRSNLDYAEVYLDWALKGHTPLWLNGVTVSGLLVVARDGHEPLVRQIDYRESGELAAHLREEAPYPLTRLLLLMADDAPSVAFAILRTALVDTGFTLPSLSDVQLFEQAERQAGGLSHAGFRAWTRATFSTNRLVKGRTRLERRELGTQSGILAGTVRTLVTIDLDIYDLGSGSHLTTIAAAGSAFASEQARSLQEALAQASTDAAKQFRERLQR